MTLARMKIRTHRDGVLPALCMAALAATGVARPAEAGDLRCNLTVQSRDGGALNLTGENIPPQFQMFTSNFWADWRPPASNHAVEFDIAWNQDNLEHLGPIEGVVISFKLPRGVARQDLSVSFATGDGRIWTASNSALTYGKLDAHERYVPNVGRLTLHDMGQDGADLLETIKATGKVHIAVKAKAREYLSTRFDLSDLAARDALFIQARDRVRAADPKACTTKPRKIHYDVATPFHGRRTYKAECVGPDGKTTLKSVTLDKPPVYDICG